MSLGILPWQEQWKVGARVNVFSNASGTVNCCSLRKMDKIQCKQCLLKARDAPTDCAIASGPDPGDFTHE